MKVKSPSLLKKILAALSSKTNELRVRIMIFFLLHKNMDKTTLTNTFSHKLHALVSHHHHNPHHTHHLKKKNDDHRDSEDHVHAPQSEDEHVDQYDHHEEEEEESCKASLLMYYNQVEGGGALTESVLEDVPRAEEEMEEKLTHALFEESKVAMEEEEEGVAEDVFEGGDRVEEVKEVGEEDIDQAADLFIQRFKRQIQLQKQYSLDRHQQRLLQANV